MNILYCPQISMYDKQTKQLLPMADGNINMLRNTINEWKKHRPDDKFFVLIPEGVFLPHHIDLNIDCQYFTYKNYVVSARINRYNFPMKEFSSILRDYKFDLLINDVIELTPNFKQMFKIEFNYEPKIISNIRHVDDSDKSDYILSVLDGIRKSDLVTILSDSMRNNLRNQIIEAGIDVRIANNTLHFIETFEPSVCAYEIEKYLMHAQIIDLSKVIITFPGRLSIGEEQRTNWDKFIDAILKVRENRQDFEVYFTDPNNALPNHLKLTQENWIKYIDKNREEFLSLLHKTDIIVSLMDIEGFGGISIREALLFDCLPIIPYVHEYKKMAPAEDYPGFIDSPIRVNELALTLEWAITSIKYNRQKRRYDYQAFGMQFTVEEQFKNLLPKLEALLNG